MRSAIAAGLPDTHYIVRTPALGLHMCLCLSCLHKDSHHCGIQNPAEANAMERLAQSLHPLPPLSASHHLLKR